MNTCPTCGSAGKLVDTQTIKALLIVTLEVLRASPYRFCAVDTCTTVYFSEDQIHTISEDQLCVQVYQKHLKQGDVLVCYCFYHSLDSIRCVGKTRVIEQVMALTKRGICACDIRNPQGSCCLGNLRMI